MATHRRSRSAAKRGKNHSQVKPKSLTVGALQELIKESKVIRISDVALKVRKRLNVELTLEKLNELFKCEALSFVEAYRTGLGHVCEVRVTPKCNGTIFYHGKNIVQNGRAVDKENEAPKGNGGESDESFSMMSDAKADDQESLQDTSEMETIESASPQPDVKVEERVHAQAAEEREHQEEHAVLRQEEKEESAVADKCDEQKTAEKAKEDVVVKREEKPEDVTEKQSEEIHNEERAPAVAEVNISVDVAINDAEKSESVDEVVKEQNEAVADLQAAEIVSEAGESVMKIEAPGEQTDRAEVAQVTEDLKSESTSVDASAEPIRQHPAVEDAQINAEVEESQVEPVSAASESTDNATGNNGDLDVDRSSVSTAKEPSIKEGNGQVNIASPQDNEEPQAPQNVDAEQAESNVNTEVTTANTVKQPLLENNDAEDDDDDDELEKKSQKKGRCCCSIS